MSSFSSPQNSGSVADTRQARRGVLKIVLSYAVFSALYIVTSDQAVHLIFSDPDQVLLVSMTKGWAFVLVTAVLLYLLVNRLVSNVFELSRRENESEAKRLRVLSLLESIASNSTDAIFAKDTEGRYLFFNREAARVTGKRQDEVIGRDDAQLFQPEQVKQLIANDRQVMAENRTVSFKETLTTADGDLTYLATKGPLHDKDGKVIGMFGISRDMTEMVRATESLQQNEESLRQMSSMAKIGGWEFDVATRVGTWTEEIARIYDVDPADKIEVDFGLSVFHDEWREKIETALQLAIELGRPYDLELEMVTSKGRHKWVRTVGMPVLEWDRVARMHGFMQDVTERKHIERALQEREDNYRTLTEQSPAIIYRADMDDASKTTYISPRISDLGYSPIDWINTPDLWLESIHPDDRQRVLDELAQAHASGNDFSSEYRMKTKQGEWRCFQDEARIVLDASGHATCLQGMMLDITERKKTEQQLHLWGQAFEHAQLGLAIVDPKNNTFLAVNPAFSSQRGYTVDELQAKPILSLYSAELHEEIGQKIAELDRTGHSVFESTHLRKDGSTFPVLLDITAIRSSEGKTTSRLVYALDISGKKAAEEKIQHLAYYDRLTGLPNRSLLTDRLSQVLALAERKEMQSALILINIDKLKKINDARGHSMGDDLLKAVADSIRGLLRDGDTLARFGGDEFAILLQSIDQQTHTAGHHAAIVAGKVHEFLQHAFRVDGDEIYITASLGVALFPEGVHDSPDNVFKRADTALHRAKAGGGNQTMFFESAMSKSVEHYFQIERELHRGIAAGELLLYLQPQIDTTRKMVGAEALVRWQNPERGLVPPGVFIPVAEESDLIIAVDVWVFTEVCRLLAQQQVAEFPCRISVNVSPRHFKQPGFVTWVKNVLADTGADPTHLTLEVTEGLVIDNLNDVVAKMNELTAIGIHFSIDDFGTGYSSLAYLKRLPIHELKIDKAFIQDAPNDPDDAALVETILAVAKNLHLKVVAEGVETAEQAAFLEARAKVIYQGYFFGKPEPVNIWRKRLELPA